MSLFSWGCSGEDAGTESRWSTMVHLPSGRPRARVQEALDAHWLRRVSSGWVSEVLAGEKKELG